MDECVRSVLVRSPWLAAAGGLVLVATVAANLVAILATAAREGWGHVRSFNVVTAALAAGLALAALFAVLATGAHR